MPNCFELSKLYICHLSARSVAVRCSKQMAVTSVIFERTMIIRKMEVDGLLLCEWNYCAGKYIFQRQEDLLKIPCFKTSVGVGTRGIWFAEREWQC